MHECYFVEDFYSMCVQNAVLFCMFSDFIRVFQNIPDSPQVQFLALLYLATCIRELLQTTSEINNLLDTLNSVADSLNSDQRKVSSICCKLFFLYFMCIFLDCRCLFRL